MRSIRPYLPALFLAVLAGCCGNDESELIAETVEVISGPGYWFHLVFIALPLVIIIIKLYSEFREVSESLISLEGQVRRILARLDEMGKTKVENKPAEKIPTIKKTAAKKKKSAKKSTAKKSKKSKAAKKKRK